MHGETRLSRGRWRVWKRAGTRLPGRGFVCFRYGGAVANCDLLVRLLDGVETPDEALQAMEREANETFG